MATLALWFGAGAPAQQRLLADLNRTPAAPASSDPLEWCEASGGVYFAASTLLFGRELWFVDATGTPALAADVLRGAASSQVREVRAFGSGVAFSAYDGRARQVFAVDGPRVSARQLSSVVPALVDFAPRDLVSVGSRLFFTADDGQHGRELWISAGVVGDARLLADIAPGLPTSQPSSLVPFGSGIAFFADDGAHGFELWVSDGTAAGTRLVRDLNPGVGQGVSSARPVAFGGELYFAGNDGRGQFDLHATNGNSTRLVFGLPAGTRPPESLVARPSGVAFVSPETAAGPHQVFVSDGTAAGTVALGIYARVEDLAAFADNQLLLIAVVGTRPTVLGSDGTAAGTRSLAVTIRGLDSYGPSRAGSRLFFHDGEQVFVTDGTDAGTLALLPSGTTLASAPLGLADGRAVFGATTPQHGSEPWVSDGTRAGTRLLADVDAAVGTQSSNPVFLASVGGRALFQIAATSDNFLASSDGTPQGTRTLTSTPGQLRVVAELSDAVVLLEEGVQRLWRTDGTVAGTVLLANVSADVPSVRHTLGIAIDGHRAVFSGSRDNGLTSQLWVTDGTPSGTRVLHDLRPGGRARAGSFARAGGTVYFVADDGVVGFELWRTDGTVAGTRLVADVQPRTITVAPMVLGSVGARVLFQANDGGTGVEAWVSDGTAAGTARLVDLNPGAGSTTFTGQAVVVGMRALLPVSRGVLATAGQPGDAQLLPLPALSTFVFPLADRAVLASLNTLNFAWFTTDGTASGTQRLPLDLAPFPVNGTRVSDNRLVLSGTSSSAVDVLLLTDGTAAGTREIGRSAVSGLRPVDGRVVHANVDVLHGREPWSTDVGATAFAEGLGCGGDPDAVRLRASEPELARVLTFHVATPHAASALLLANSPVAPVRFAALGQGCTLFVDPAGPLVSVPLPSTGSIGFLLPAQPELVGVRLAAQAVSGPAPSGIALSNGVRLWLDL